MFEELGLYYIGPVDGHNIEDLVTILENVKSTTASCPGLIHVVTEKGHGYPYDERAANKYHDHEKIFPLIEELNDMVADERKEGDVVTPRGQLDA
ncbi:unnamed protein product [Sphagnum tenellum]